MRKKGIAVAGAAIVIGVVLLVALVPSPYRVRVSVRPELVGPDDKAFELLLSEASLREIQAEVKASGKAVDEISCMGASLLSEAAMQQRHDVALWLLQQGANPNGVHPSTVPLSFAVWNEDLEMVELLLDYGADPQLDTGGGITPLKKAVMKGNQAIIDAMQERRKAQGAHQAE